MIRSTLRHSGCGDASSVTVEGRGFCGEGVKHVLLVRSAGRLIGPSVNVVGGSGKACIEEWARCVLSRVQACRRGDRRVAACYERGRPSEMAEDGTGPTVRTLNDACYDRGSTFWLKNLWLVG